MKQIKLGVLALCSMLLVLSTQVNASQELDPTVVDFNEVIELNPHLEHEVKCLAKNIYYEAGSESYDGKVAVAQVTINRLKSGKFADSICGVVKQKTFWQGRTVCQFSWSCTKKAKESPPQHLNNYQESLDVAKRVMIEGFGLHYLKDALYFHATHVNPNWGKVKVAKVGNHVFYRDKN